MVDDGVKRALSGWGHQLIAIYDTFLLRDLLGYVFPGAVLLLGADRLLFSKLSVPASIERLGSTNSTNWLAVALGLAAAYSAGVFLRLLGTWTRILVIAPVVGRLGDPWDLKAASTPTCRPCAERLWKSPHEDAVVDKYRTLYPPGSDERAKTTAREGVFLNLAGILGFALLAVGLTSLLSFFGVSVGLPVRPLSGLVTALLVVGGIVFIVRHYTHARAIQLLNKP